MIIVIVIVIVIVILILIIDSDSDIDGSKYQVHKALEYNTIGDCSALPSSSTTQ